MFIKIWKFNDLREKVNAYTFDYKILRDLVSALQQTVSL